MFADDFCRFENVYNCAISITFSGKHPNIALFTFDYFFRYCRIPRKTN